MDKATVIDVARAAGVSIATVSCVLNKNYPVSEKTRKRVEEAIEQLRYEANRAAQTLRSNSSFMLGLIVPYISNPYFMTIAQGIERVVEKDGYVLVCSSSGDSPRKEDLLLRSMQQYNVDGIVLLTCRDEGEYAQRCGVSVTVPCVHIDGLVSEINGDLVGYRERESTRHLAEYVISCGHRDVAVLNGTLRKRTGRLRWRGIQEAFHVSEIPLRREWMLSGHFDRARAKAEILRIFSADQPKPTAIISASNAMTEGALEALQELGLRVPEDVSVASCNRVENDDVLGLRITHLADDGISVGEKVGRLLLDQIESQKTHAPHEFTKVYFDKELVLGESVRRI